ncbi:hypothetical protein [Microvirga sp. Mcv34]|uniref:hypothetical protein n=1 Tax=Microvirga sp. Mcv34 TaxID=2926016 RepID=UPI0021C67870|nr:hypothetical protein [Microvirga sp. Mcv34]
MATNADLPTLVMEPVDCPICGAKTVTQADRKCKANQDQSLKGQCMMTSHDEDGNFVMPTAESYAAFEKGFAAFIGQ